MILYSINSVKDNSENTSNLKVVGINIDELKTTNIESNELLKKY